MIKKIFASNLYTMLVYVAISLVLVALSSLSLLANSSFNFYPIVVTAISFAFGGVYLLLSLISMTKKVELTGSKGIDTARMMGSNFLRFSILMLSIAVNFLFIYFYPHDGELEKWVFLLLLISGVPMFLNIFLFYMKGKYVE